MASSYGPLPANQYLSHCLQGLRRPWGGIENEKKVTLSPSPSTPMSKSLYKDGDDPEGEIENAKRVWLCQNWQEGSRSPGRKDRSSNYRRPLRLGGLVERQKTDPRSDYAQTSPWGSTLDNEPSPEIPWAFMQKSCILLKKKKNWQQI